MQRLIYFQCQTKRESLCKRDTYNRVLQSLIESRSCNQVSLLIFERIEKIGIACRNQKVRIKVFTNHRYISQVQRSDRKAFRFQFKSCGLLTSNPTCRKRRLSPYHLASLPSFRTDPCSINPHKSDLSSLKASSESNSKISANFEKSCWINSVKTRQKRTIKEKKS